MPTTTITAVADAQITDAPYNASNFGGSTTARIGTFDEGKKDETFNRFLITLDVSGIPTADTIDDATLTLIYTGSGTLLNAQTFVARRQIRPTWSEGGSSWDYFDNPSLWTLAGGDWVEADKVSIVLSAPGNLVFAGLGPLALDARDVQSGLLHLIITGPEVPPEKYLTVWTREVATSSLRPQLVVNHTPPPRDRFDFNATIETARNFDALVKDAFNFDATILTASNFNSLIQDAFAFDAMIETDRDFDAII